MSSALKTYLDEQRGRSARLAEAIDASPSYVSDLANGKKVASVSIWQRIAAFTGLPLDALIPVPGFRESDVEPFAPNAARNRLGDAASMVAPGVRRRDYFRATRPCEMASVLAGDVLVVEMSFDADKVRDGQLVVAQMVGENSTGRTVVARAAQPWLIGNEGRIVGHIGHTAAIVALLAGVLRGPGLAET